MLSFDKRSIETKAAVVDDQLSADDAVWQEHDPVPEGPLRVTGRLSAAGAGRFYWHGQVAGDLVLPCRRCLADTTVHVEDESHLIFAEAGSEETDDPDVQVLDARSYEIDLRPALREQWLLNVPTFVVCREECRGLCPTCGKNLNEETCDCPESRDARWDALRRVQPKQ